MSSPNRIPAPQPRRGDQIGPQMASRLEESVFERPISPFSLPDTNPPPEYSSSLPSTRSGPGGLRRSNAIRRRAGASGAAGSSRTSRSERHRGHLSDWERLQSVLETLPPEQQARGLHLARRLLLPTGNSERYAVWHAVCELFYSPDTGLTDEQRQAGIDFARALALPSRDPRDHAHGLALSPSLPSEPSLTSRTVFSEVSWGDGPSRPRSPRVTEPHPGLGLGHGSELRHGPDQRGAEPTFSQLVGPDGRHPDGPPPPRLARPSTLSRAASVVRNLVRRASSRSSRRGRRAGSRAGDGGDSPHRCL